MTFENHLREMLASVVRDVVREELGASRGHNASGGGSEYLTYGEAAELLSVSASTIKRWVRDGKLATFGAGKLKRVKGADARAVLAPSPATPKRAEVVGLKAMAAAILSKSKGR